MKKKRSQKNSSDFKKSHVFALIGLFLVLGFALSFMDVFITGEAVKGIDTSKIDASGVSSVFDKWQTGNVDNGISKIFIFFIVTILIFVSVDLLDVIKSSFIKFILALAVSYLATAYITPDEVFGVVQSYTALGLTLTSILPFVFLFLFSAKFLSAAKWGDAGKVMLDRVLWVVFTLFLGYRIGVLFFSETTYSFVVFGITGISVLVAGFIVVVHWKYVGVIKDLNRKLLEQSAKDEKAAGDARVTSGGAS
jgi:hypothetical protein